MTPSLAALREFAPPGWTLAAVLDEARRLGWESAEGVGEWDQPIRTVSADGVSGRLRETTYEPARAEGTEVEHLTFALDVRLDDVVGAWGPPASVVDGPALRWYAPTVRWEVSPDGSGVRIVAEPFPWSEDEENRTFEWADELDGMPYRWRADRDDLLPDGLYLSGGRSTENLDEAMQQLLPLFCDLQRAAVLVPALIGRPTWIVEWVAAPTAFVQGYFAPNETVLEVWNEGERAHLLELPATEESGELVGQIVRETVEASGVSSADELRWTLFADRTDHRLRTLGLGLSEGQ